MERLAKSFAGVAVLNDVSLDIYPGQVHGLLGINGSGKSTLIKMLAGYHTADSGTIRIAGSVFDFPDGITAYRPKSLPLAFVHQDLGLLPEMSVTENFHLRSLAYSPSAKRIRWSDRHRETKDAFQEYGVTIDPSRPVRTLTPVERARLAIIRAYNDLPHVGSVPGLLVLDEPTVFLPVHDREVVWGLVHALTARGGSVLLVSHDLSDVRAIADVVTVLRDGRAVGTLDVASATDSQIVTLLLGHAGTRLEPPTKRGAIDVAMSSGLVDRGQGAPSRDGSVDRDRPEAAGDSAAAAAPGAGFVKEEPIQVCDLQGGQVRQATFNVACGEIVGITGVPGSGYEDVPYLLYGSQPASGSLRIAGRSINLRRSTPRFSRAYGVALVPADRQTQGGFPGLTAGENFASSMLEEYCKARLVSSRKIRSRFLQAAEMFGIDPPDPDKEFRYFSGGNQQKIVLAKWLSTLPRLLIVHEPTQGVDVKAKEDVIDALTRAAEAGTSVIWVSIDQSDLATVANRVLVFRNGGIGEELDRPLTPHQILEASYG